MPDNAANNAPSPAKLCPRCGAFYQDLKSQTCPQCFARLEPLDDRSAQHLSQEQAARVADPAARERKARDDERYKEQSFGACLAVAGIVFATVVVSILFIWLAASRHRSRLPASLPASRLSSAAAPTAGALLPPMIGGFTRQKIEQEGRLPGAGAALYLGVYGDGVQIYAASLNSTTRSQQAALDLAASLAAQQHSPPLFVQEITTAKAHYAILAKSAADVARAADALTSENTQP